MRSKRKEQKPGTQKQVDIIGIIGCILVLLSFVAIAIPTILSDEQGHYENGWVFLVAFFVLSIAGCVLLSMASDQESLDKEKLKKEMETTPFTVLPGGEKSRILRALQEHGFQGYTNGILKKIKSSYSVVFQAPYYYYFMLMAAEDISSAYERFNELLMSAIPWTELQSSYGSLCPILFIYKEEISEGDLQTLRELSTKALLTPAIREAYINTLPVLVHAHTGECIYLEKYTRKCFGRDYSRCCKLLKEYLKYPKNQEQQGESLTAP